MAKLLTHSVTVIYMDTYETDMEETDIWEDDDDLRDDEGSFWENDMEADAEALASAGWGTDEDYGCFGGDDW